MAQLNNINVLLGVTGGIAAYKSAELVRLLKKQRANVKVVLTRGAQQFITPLTLQTLSENAVYDDIFDPQAELQMSHIELARWADLVLIAPATAQVIFKLAHGAADDLLSTLCLATTAPINIAPAMNQQMWQHWATQQNIKQLTSHGTNIIGPAQGEQACGEIGPGRMVEPADILETLIKQQPHMPLSHLNILITAGPTQEAIDAVRYISNKSSGKMGYALAQAAADVGANVTLISGPTQLSASNAITTIPVTTANEMHKAVIQQVDQHHIVISAAAVADYTVREPASQKIKKSDTDLSLSLSKTQDIIQTIGQMPNKPFLVGFAAETDDLIDNAKQKLNKKNLDMIVANLVSDPSIGFYSDDNAVTVITDNHQVKFARQPKTQLAKQLINLIANLYQQQ